MKNMKSSQKDIITKFAIKFILLCGVLYGVSGWVQDTSFEPINGYTAAMLGSSLKVLGIKPSVQGVFVSADSFSVKVITECSAIFISILFFSFVLAYPTSWKKKAIGLLFGIPILFAVNILRLVVVFITGIIRPDLFEYMHLYFWQIVLIIFVLMLCLAWLKLIVIVRMKDTPLSFILRFIAITSIPFLAWIYLHKGYVLMNSSIIKFLLKGYHIHFSPDMDVIYSSTFNLIVFCGLILATQSITKRKKVKALIIGLTVMFVMQLIYRLFHVLFAGFQMQYALKAIVILKIINQYFLPFGLWIAFTYKDIFKARGMFTCPICGEEKAGIMQHIKAKHGEDALKDERVMPLLEKLELEKDEHHMRVYGYTSEGCKLRFFR